MQDYKKLNVWVRTHQFVLSVYAASRHFPDDERFGLTSQLRRAGASIAANIVEGSQKESNLDFRRFLFIALGSAAESEYFLLLAKDLDILESEQYANLSDEIIEIKKMLAGLIKSLAQKN